MLILVGLCEQVNKDAGEEKDKATTTTAEVESSEVNTEEEEEEEEHTGSSHCQDCLLHCKAEFTERVWPAIKPLLTFTISPVGKFGMAYSYTGCLLAFFSAFTISYQVNQKYIVQCTCIITHNCSMQAAFQSNFHYLWAVNYLFEAYFITEVSFDCVLSY